MRSSRQLSPSLTWPRLASPRLTLLADRPVLARRLLTRRISATASSVSAMLPRSRACACTRSPIGVRACARAHVCGSICHATSDVVSLQDFQHWKQAKTFAAQPSSVADGGAALKSFEVHTTSPAPTAVPKPSCDLSWSRLLVSHHALFCVQAEVVLHASCVRIVVVGPLLLSSHTGGRPRGGRFATRRLCLTCRRSRVCLRSRLTPSCLPVWHMCARRSS